MVEAVSSAVHTTVRASTLTTEAATVGEAGVTSGETTGGGSSRSGETTAHEAEGPSDPGGGEEGAVDHSGNNYIIF